MTNSIKYEEVSGEVSVAYTMHFNDYGELQHTHLVKTVGQQIEAQMVEFQNLPEGIKKLIPIK